MYGIFGKFSFSKIIILRSFFLPSFVKRISYYHYHFFCGGKIHVSWKENERTVCAVFWFAFYFPVLFPIYWQSFKMGYSTDRWSHSIQVHKETSHSHFWPTLTFLWKLMKDKILKEASDLFKSFLLLADHAAGGKCCPRFQNAIGFEQNNCW